MTKNNYQIFVQKIDEVLKKYYPKIDNTTYFKRIIDTNKPFGKIEIIIWESTGKERFYTVFTKVEKPYFTLNHIKNKTGFNVNTGKYNISDKNLNHVCLWLENYLKELLYLKSELIGHKKEKYKCRLYILYFGDLRKFLKKVDGSD